MNKRMLSRSSLSMAFVVIAVLLFGVLASAAEFSADSVMSMPGQSMGSTKMGPMTVGGKLYVKGVKIRQEMSMGQGKQITIVRPDKGVVWMIMPSTKSYMEIPTPKKASAPKWQDTVKAVPGMKKVGTERVNGYQCDKYQGVVKAKGQSAKVTLWVSPKLNHEVKTQAVTGQGTVVMQLKNIRAGSQPNSLFEVPRGYKKQSMQSGGPGGMGGRRGGGGMPPMGRK